MGYIFEHEIETIINVVRTRTIGEDDVIQLKQILKAAIHPSIKAYFHAEVEKILRQERAHEYYSKKLPYGIPEVLVLRAQIDKLLTLHYQFSKSEFESLLDESVHFQFNYLCRPRWTLLNFIFGSNRKVSTAFIASKLKYCVDYSYFPYFIQRYNTLHGFTEMQYEDFQTLIRKIDNEIVALHSPQELPRMLTPLFTFLEATLPPSTNELTIPINAAIVFFEDKQLDTIKERLELERDVKAHQYVTMDQLTQIIESIYIDCSISIQNNEPKDPSAFKDSHEELMELIESSSQHFDEPTEAGTSLNKSECQHTTHSTIQNDFTTNGLAQKLEELRALFPKKVYDNIQRVLFKRDETKFLNVLSEIATLTTWDEVAHYLDSFYLLGNIDPFSEEAVFFTDTLYEYFHTKK
ncbi:MAG: hypothetical protein N3A63_05960 [Bacteroidetes bacterium]|nr:hypothetical protein [Bacteroidota bacterium]